MIAALVVGLVLAADSGSALVHPAKPGPGTPSAPRDTLVRVPGCVLRLAGGRLA